jgi:hypothetical protein
VQLDLYTQIILSVLSVYQSANKSKCHTNYTGWQNILFFVALTKVGKHNRIFALNSNLLLERILSDARLIFE